MPLYEEIEFEDLTFDVKNQIYWYPCPCGDKFKISLEELWDGEDIADCQSCTLFIQVIYEESDLPPLRDDDEDDDEDDNQVKSGSDNKKDNTEKSLEVKKETDVIEAVKNLTIQ